MEFRTLAGLGPVSVIGCRLSLESPMSSSPVAEGLLRDALRRGVRVVDLSSAADPRPSEALVGAVARAEPELCVLSTIPRGELPRGSGATGLDRTAAAVQQSLRRLGRDRLDALVVPWEEIQPLREFGALSALQDALPRMGVRSLAARLDDDALDAAGVRALAAAGVRIFLARWSLVEREIAGSVLSALRETGSSLLAVDPHAEGRLDGRRVLSPAAGRRAGSPPLDPSELRRAMAPVLELRYLTEGTGRTLIQAAVQFALDPPEVASVLCPLEDPRLTGQICEYAAAPAFSVDERRRLGLPA